MSPERREAFEVEAASLATTRGKAILPLILTGPAIEPLTLSRIAKQWISVKRSHKPADYFQWIVPEFQAKPQYMKARGYLEGDWRVWRNETLWSGTSSDKGSNITPDWRELTRTTGYGDETSPAVYYSYTQGKDNQLEGIGAHLITDKGRGAHVSRFIWACIPAIEFWSLITGHSSWLSSEIPLSKNFGVNEVTEERTTIIVDKNVSLFE
ncbi:hypothetical protein P691DRAFT_851603 [Macrolepiota fuliginosa MF-IS2]|uniref:Uncharacterized protein n=1 Tax=Macrolepiota fuliginosa MF-IS2 TaxID=1400762 RepID=A0A9P6BWE8_9AGAR|nr:hypothetical protein P691DRAFT_851603 [Macrolepiota fuliginosa MF-IS2]